MEGKEGYVENNSQFRRTTEDRAAIELARTGGEEDRSSLLERADTVVALGEKKSEQTPFPEVRDDQALNELQHDNEVAHQFLNGLNELVALIKAQKTMVCLNAIDYMNLSPESEPFYANNRGGDASTIKLIMNDPAKPFLLAVSSSDDNGFVAYVTPSIIPAGAKLFVKNASGGYGLSTAPSTEQTPEQNREVRKLIKESFTTSYGDDNANGWLPDIKAAENRDKPITLGDLSAAFGKAAEWIEKGNVPKK